jgi:DNA-binding transcriptional regulator YiaG
MLETQLMPKGDSITKRFWSKVKRRPNSCWLWTGKPNDDGYGLFYLDQARGVQLAHRVSYAFTFGPIPDGLLVLHRCDNTICVRPDHLFTGTHATNAADCVSKGRHSSGAQPSDENFHITISQWRMRLARAMKIDKLYHREAALLLDVPAQTYRNWEYSRRAPRGLALSEVMRRCKEIEEYTSLYIAGEGAEDSTLSKLLAEIKFEHEKEAAHV